MKPKICWICGKPLSPGSKKRRHDNCERKWSYGYQSVDSHLLPGSSRPGMHALDATTRQEHGRGFDHWDEPWGLVKGLVER